MILDQRQAADALIAAATFNALTIAPDDSGGGWGGSTPLPEDVTTSDPDRFKKPGSGGTGDPNPDEGKPIGGGTGVTTTTTDPKTGDPNAAGFNLGSLEQLMPWIVIGTLVWVGTRRRS